MCIDDRFPPEIFIYYANLPSKNVVYTIRGVEVGVGLKGEPEIAVTLFELVNPASSTPPHRERGFKIERFVEIEAPEEEEEDSFAELETFCIP